MPVLRARETNPVVVHEWGTFTSLQDENGKTMGGINVDDEPVPDFIDGDGGKVVVAQHSEFLHNFGLPPYWAGKEWAANDPAVTMRLETPVLYIYPPKGATLRSVPPLNVQVAFHGGVLSQFFPWAKFDGLTPINGMHEGALKADTTTSLTWRGVRLGSTHQPVETDDQVWTTPRETSAPLLEVKAPGFDAKGVRQEMAVAEHFLFYRGVGHLDAPLSVAADVSNAGRTDLLDVRPGFLATEPHPPVPLAALDLNADYAAAWLTEIRPDGSCAFHALPPFSEGATTRLHSLVEVSSKFAPADFSAANLDALKASMQAKLVREGLFPDEASAMLRTWELSYFKSPGLRFFYTVPRSWTDHVLPLRVTGAPVQITRVMIGRIELISSAQKAALARLAAGPCPDLNAVKATARSALAEGHYSPAETRAFYRGDRPLRDLGIAIPPLVQDYLDLGRFRDVLVLREQKMKPTPALADFIRNNSLGEQGAYADRSGSADPALVAAPAR